ncbi:MAG: hypothetical protein V4710_11680 [Verrucomicrobiota bacterium]
MGEIRFSCERCGQNIVADAAAAGLNAECPSCHLPLIIPELDPDAEEDSVFSPSPDPLLADAQLALAYMREQLEATRDQCERLAAHECRIHAQLRCAYSERRVLISQVSDYKQRLRLAEARLAESAHIINPDDGLIVEAGNKPDAGVSQTGDPFESEKSLRMQKRLERLEAELMEARHRLELSEQETHRLTHSCNELKKENAALLRTARETGKPDPQRPPIDGMPDLERLCEDNALLRGIITRQNALLETWHAELQHFKKARLALRILYALFAVSLVVLAIVAMDILAVVRI